MFEAASTSTWLESLRVPVRHTGAVADSDVVVTWTASGRRLAWPRARAGRPYAPYALDGIPLFARGLASAPPAWGTGWAPVAEVTKDDAPAAAIWRAADGSIFVPFDPDDAIRALQSEAYVTDGGAAARELVKGAVRKSYYRLRPLLPRPMQLSLRRAFSRIQQRQTFPAWPLETALHDLVDRLLQLAADVADEPIPWLAPWPRPYTWALVLTHDVETQVGYDRIDELCREERDLGYRSSWNLVPERDYVVEDELVRRLLDGGWEVGLHGLHHDGRDLESERLVRERLPRMREWAERWAATGFRAPATQRSWSIMPTLGFAYDSSYPDTDPFEPQGGGCCSWLPFFNGELLELPITLPQDHTLFEILGEQTPERWLAKTAALRQRGGMAVLDTHPDYLGEDPARSAYLDLMRAHAQDKSMWRALPRDVDVWWRRRAATVVERSADGWRAVGPAEPDAALLFAVPQAA